MQKSRIKNIFKRYINGTRGVISLFLALLLVPFTMIAGALINAGRINSAVAIFDEALCNASNSTLGTYDSFIRKRFALMSISQDVSDGGTRFGATKEGYSADDFINDLFSEYMTKNLECLSNTYGAAELSATGLYPLSDPAVLKAAVLQTGKVTVPVKLAMDWGSIDDMIKQFTKDIPKAITGIANLVSSGADVVSDIDKLTEQQEALEKEIENCNKARTEYEQAYSDFVKEANAFNTLVDNINSTKGQVASYQSEVNSYSAQTQNLQSQIDEKETKIEELNADKENDHKDEIKKLKEEIDDLKDEIDEIAPGYNDALKNLKNAQSRLSNYENQFSEKRQTAVDAKCTYYNKIVALRDKVETVSGKAEKFQGAAASLVKDATSTITNVITTGLDVAHDAKEHQIKELQSENDYYTDQMTKWDGYSEYENHYAGLIQENESAIRNLNDQSMGNANVETITKSAVGSVKDMASDLTSFAERDLVAEYNGIYNKLDTIRLKVNQIVIPEDYQKFSYNDCYYKVVNPMEKADVAKLISDLEDQIVDNAGWAILKMIINFFKELIKLDVLYSTDLKSEIDLSLYSEIGGLPSQKDTPSPSIYDVEDAKLSEQYKSLLNAYSLDGENGDSSDESDSESIEGLINEIKKLTEPFKLKNLAKLWRAAQKLRNVIFKFAIGNVLASAGEKLLLVGYVSYNTANRTTYDEKALTGASYDLPINKENNGYVFSGAETEYILFGNSGEVENQKSAFWRVLGLRAPMNIYTVFKDPTVLTIATTLDAFTFGIGGTIYKILCIAVEALLDSIIICNGGEVPILKTFCYATPTGILKLVEKMWGLKISDADKQTIYEKASEFTYDANEKLKNTSLSLGKYVKESVSLPRYDDLRAQDKAADKTVKGKILNNLFDINYTKCLQLMLLVRSSNTIVERLADIIQMEASYHAHEDAATYAFNLDKSYTYLRVSGNFSSNVFIKVGEEDSLTSQQRIVYNGY